MMGMWEATIVLQQQALEAHRQQVAIAQKWIEAGADAVTAQKQGLAAVDASTKAWKSWFALWGVKG